MADRVRNSDFLYWIKWIIAYVAIRFHNLFQRKRFDIYDIFAPGDPVKVGYIVPEAEKELESPFSESHLQEKSDEILFYGINSKSECLLVWLTRRPNQMADARVYLKMADGKSYSLCETKKCAQQNERNIETFSCGKLKMNYLSPMRRWKIFYCGMIRETSGETNQERFLKFTFLWKSSSDVYDCTLDTNPRGFASAIAGTKWNSLVAPPIEKFTDTFNFYAQAGAMSGTISVDESKYEMYLFGEKFRNLGRNGQIAGSKFTSVLGSIPSTGFKFHLINVSEPFICTNLPVGFVVNQQGILQPVTKIEINLEPICSNQTSFEAQFEDGDLYKVSGLIKQPAILSSGQKWREFLELSFIEFTMDGRKGAGIFITGEVYKEQSTRNDEVKFELLPSMPKFIPLTVPLSDDASQLGKISGGKGSSLGKLAELSEKDNSFIVPKGFVVTTAAYNEFLNPNILDAVAYLEKVAYGNEAGDLKKTCTKVSSIVEKSELPNKIRRSISKELKNIFGEGINQLKFAVRSSSIGEDTETLSAAGQMDTFLGIQSLEEIFQTVKKCWASQFGHKAVEYKRRYGQKLNLPMAVVVQEMVSCEASGVVFTCDPVTGNPSIITIAANYGLGESVVSGFIEPDTFILRMNDCGKVQLESTTIGKKQHKVVMKDASGIVVEDVDEDFKRSSCLSKDTAERLGKIAMKIEKFYESSRDIEWGISNSQIYILQSRPVTHEAAETDYEIIHEFDAPLRCEVECFSMANVGELFPEPISPLGSEIFIKIACNYFKRKGMERGFTLNNLQNFYIQPGLPIFSHRLMLSVFEILSRYGVLTQRAKAHMISLFGRTIEDPEILSYFRMRLPKKGVKLSLKLRLIQYWDLYFFDFGIKKLKEKTENYHLKFLKENTAMDTYKTLLHSCSDFDEVINRHIMCMDVSSDWNMEILNLLGKAKRSFDTDVYSDFAMLTASTSNIESANVPRALQEMADQIADDIGHRKFKSMTIEEAEKWLQTTNTQSGLLFKKFLERHGHRCIQEFDIRSITWGMNPKILVKLLQNLTDTTKERKGKQSHDGIFSRLYVPLKFLSKCHLRFILFNCQRAIRTREYSKSIFIRAIEHWRQGFRHLGALMVSEGRLPDEDLIFFLTFDEIGDLLITRLPSIISRAIKRRKVFPAIQKIRFPLIMKGLPKPLIEEKDSDSTNGFMPDLTMKGIPLSRGIAKGYARVATNLEEADNLKEGEILITICTDIGWSPYFPIISGVATEIGGLISHGAVISREYGLPCVIGLEGATKKIRTGDYILLDGTKGILQRLAQPDVNSV